MPKLTSKSIQYDVFVNGLRLAYTDWGGSDLNIVLVHALRSSRQNWDLVAPLLRQRWRVLALDMREHVDSGTPDNGYDMSGFASDLHGFLTRLEVSSPRRLQTYSYLQDRVDGEQ